MNRAFVTRLVFVSLVLVVAFAAVFLAVDSRPAGWPNLPPHFGRDLDLACGLLFAAAAVIAALWRRSGAENGDRTGNRELR